MVNCRMIVRFGITLTGGGAMGKTAIAFRGYPLDGYPSFEACWLYRISEI